MRFFNVPTMLTLVRLILSPLMLPILFVQFLPWNYLWLNILLALLFGAFCLTDFFDGFLARRYKQVTALGKILDPIADKFLVYSTLIALLAAGKIFFYWVIILIGREIFVMGLRQLALEHAIDLSVSWLGKIKTVAQMALLFILILNPYQAAPWNNGWNLAEYLLLVAALVLSLVSAHNYYDSFVTQFKKKYVTSTDDNEDDACCYCDDCDECEG